MVLDASEQWFALMVQIMGKDKGLKYIAALAKQNVLLRRESSAMRAQLIAAGEAPMDIDSTLGLVDQLKKRAHRLVYGGSGARCYERPWGCFSTIASQRRPAIRGFRALPGGSKARPRYWETSCKDRPVARTREHQEFATSSPRPGLR